jgi:DNA-binding NtrC family response regulator
MMTGPITSFFSSDQDFFASGRLPQRSASKRADGDPIRVLVVDDEMRIADTTAEVLQSAGFDARPAYTGQSALKLAAEFRPDCLLSDVVMSGMNGVELALEFQKLQPKARVVLISGQAGISEILEDAASEGIRFEVLSKPILPRLLIEHLRKKPRSKR